jgi:NitT/TauT family transport system substrate-binding protein
MSKPSQFQRRQFLRTAAVAGIAGAVGLRPRRGFAEPAPETTRIRFSQIPSICLAPQYAAEELLQGEGFTEVQYIKADGGRALMDDAGPYQALAAGKVDLNGGMVGELIARIAAGDPIVILGGIHAGCFELFGTDRVRSVKDLKGKTVAVPSLGASHHFFVASIAAYVGLDPNKDITFITPPLEDAVKLFVDGLIDAIFDFPPVSQELRAKNIGHVVIDGRVDRPWSQYFCCMLAANREFVRKHPTAAKRALRAIVKANTTCTLEPARVARMLVERGYATQYDYALQALKELPYSKWRDYDPEDTVRFYALRLHEAGMIKSSPQKIIAQGTDWRFFNELKKELKG